MTYFRITLKRDGEEEREIGTAPSMDLVEAWFSGAFANGLLPNPPQYTDEIRVYEVYDYGPDYPEDPSLKFVWRVSWQCFEAKPEPRKLMLV